MKIKQLCTVLSFVTIVGCSSTPPQQQASYQEYQARTNSVDKNFGESEDVSKAVLMPANMKNGKNEIKVVYVRHREINILAEQGSEEEMVFKKGVGHLQFRGVIELIGTKPALIDWRCKFYDAHGDVLYEDETSSIAKNSTGLGWHRMKMYPNNLKSVRHEDSVFKCTAPTTTAVKAQVEAHDTANDIVHYQ